MQFEVGKTYRFIGKERLGYWCNKGEMDFWLDKKPRKCIEKSMGNFFIFEGQKCIQYFYYMNISNDFEEVTKPKKSGRPRSSEPLQTFSIKISASLKGKLKGKSKEIRNLLKKTFE